MAEAATTEAAAGKDKTKGRAKGKGRSLLIAGIGAVVMLAGGGGAYMLLEGKPGVDGAQARTEARKIPVFVDLDQFTVNLRGDPDGNGGERFIQVKLVAELKDAAGGEMVKSMMPSVRNEILLLLGGKTAEELSQREGKEQLARDIVAAVNRPLEGTPAGGAVLGVNFTHLIIQ